jgi:hypothetical protein
VVNPDEILGPFGLAMAKQIARELHALRAGNSDGWVDQHSSELAPRVHCRVVRRRMQEGLLDATIVRRDGKRAYLLSPDALREEVVGKSRPGVKSCAERDTVSDEPVTGVRDRLLRKLGRA